MHHATVLFAACCHNELRYRTGVYCVMHLDLERCIMQTYCIESCEIQSMLFYGNVLTQGRMYSTDMLCKASCHIKWHVAHRCIVCNVLTYKVGCIVQVYCMEHLCIQSRMYNLDVLYAASWCRVSSRCIGWNVHILYSVGCMSQICGGMKQH